MEELIVKRENHPNHNCITIHFKHVLSDKSEWWSSEYSGSTSTKPGFADAVLAVEGVENISTRPYKIMVTKPECFDFDADGIFENVMTAMCSHFGASGYNLVGVIGACH